MKPKQFCADFLFYTFSAILNSYIKILYAFLHVLLCKLVSFVYNFGRFVQCMMYLYLYDIFSYSGPSGILGSDGKQNTPKASARRRENCCTFH